MKPSQSLALRAAAATAILTVAPLLRAQELCSTEGKQRIRSAGVTEAQIRSICPTPRSPSTAALPDYADVKSAVLDASNATGKTVALRAVYKNLGTLGSKPALLLYVDTDTRLTLWYLFFDTSHTSTVRALREGQRLTAVCRIRNLSGLGPECDLVALTLE